MTRSTAGNSGISPPNNKPQPATHSGLSEVRNLNSHRQCKPGSTDEPTLTACRYDESGALLNWEDGVEITHRTQQEEHLIDAIFAQPGPR